MRHERSAGRPQTHWAIADMRKVTRNGEDIEDPDAAPASPPALVPDDLDLFRSNLLPAEVLAIEQKMVTDRLLDLFATRLENHRPLAARWTHNPYMAAALGVSPRSVDRML